MAYDFIPMSRSRDARRLYLKVNETVCDLAVENQALVEIGFLSNYLSQFFGVPRDKKLKEIDFDKLVQILETKLSELELPNTSPVIVERLSKIQLIHKKSQVLSDFLGEYMSSTGIFRLNFEET